MASSFAAEFKACDESGCPRNLFGSFEYDKPVKVGSHPPWYPPANGDYRGLNVMNTLTGTKVPFRPAKGQSVLWYTCGPTVYDYSHMGHARAYLTFDILRRIMEDYFGYNVMYQTNITDIDDKIILRARRNKLLSDYNAKKLSFEEVLRDVNEAATAKSAKQEAKEAELKKPISDSRLERERQENIKIFNLKNKQFKATLTRINIIEKVTTGGKLDRSKVVAILKEVVSSITAAGIKGVTNVDDSEILAAELDKAYKSVSLQETINKDHQALIDKYQNQLKAVNESAKSSPSVALTVVAKDILGESLDKKYGETITDHAVFDKLSRKFEKFYMEDMVALGIKDPDVMTRVTEYVPQVVDFVRRIEEKGFAYESSGSVYLDTVKFQEAKHHYRKLVPFTGSTSADEMAESEGALGSSGEKRHPNDFALWKASKPGEPSWDSKWGKGRPGWHIECSVVASDIFGANMDIHAGGWDLRFPHHDNELAQSESYFGHQQWVNYFFHAGWLKIKGLKMSKSLKNFITIRQALEKFSARQLRLMFLLQAWDKDLNFSDQTVGDAKAKESLFVNFFGKVKDLLRNRFAYLDTKVGWLQHEHDRAFMMKIMDTKNEVHAGLCDNFDTRRAIVALSDLVTAGNKYMTAFPNTLAVMSIEKAAIYVTQILKVFGVIKGSHSIGFTLEGEGGSKEATITPYVDALKTFREKVRAAVRGRGSKDETRQQVLELCGGLRDDVLPQLGVRLEDCDDGSSLWRLDDPATLVREINEKREAQKAKALAKKAKKIKALETLIAKDRANSVSPAELFKGDANFSEFDPETGIPTKTIDGLAKNVTKKLWKKVKQQQKNFQKFQKSMQKRGAETPEAYFSMLEADLKALQLA